MGRGAIRLAKLGARVVAAFSLCFCVIVAGLVYKMQKQIASGTSTGGGAFGRLCSNGCAMCHNLLDVDPLEDCGHFIEPGDSPAWDGISMGGYASKVSVVQGRSIDFHISTDVSPFAISIWSVGANPQLMTTIDGLSVDLVDCTEKYETGCDWPAAYTLEVPPTWPSGVYVVKVPTIRKGTRYIVFWVKEADPGSTGNILFLSSVNTYQAYNPFGDKSLYVKSSTDFLKAHKVSFNRPFRNKGKGYLAMEEPFISWAEKEGYAMEYATDYDLEFNPHLLDAYEVVVIAGHSEYWSRSMRHQLRAFIDRGGRFVNLSGNTMWWQVRFEDDGRSMVCYKDYLIDPETEPEKVTDKTWDHPIYDPESAITGVSFYYGGLFDKGRTYLHKDGLGGYWVQRPDHWVFEGTGLAEGALFGRTEEAKTSVIYREMDGTNFNCQSDGKTILGPLGNTGTPRNFAILGVAPVAFRDAGSSVTQKVEYRFAAMGLYTTPAGGAVFSGSSMGWPGSLVDPHISQITRNVLDHFLVGDFPQEPANSPDTEYLFYDRFNCSCLNHDGLPLSYAGPKWYEGLPSYNYTYSLGDLTRLRYTSACGIGDGTGLEVTIDPDNPPQLSTQLKPNWGATEVLYTRVYLDFSNLAMVEGDAFSLMAHKHDPRTGRKPIPETQASLLVRYSEGKLSLMYQGGANDQEAPWVDVPADQPFLLETKWNRRVNQMALWIDGVRSQWTADLSQSKPINLGTIGLENIAGMPQGSFCVDELAFHNSRIGSPASEPEL